MVCVYVCFRESGLYDAGSLSSSDAFVMSDAENKKEVFGGQCEDRPTNSSTHRPQTADKTNVALCKVLHLECWIFSWVV